VGWLVPSLLAAWLAATDSLQTVAPGTDAPRALGWADLLVEQEQLVFTPAALRQPLQHAFLQFGSDVVREAGVVLERNRDYGIDYGRGVVFLLTPIQSERRFDVTYLRLPAPSRRQFDAATVLQREEALGGAAGASPPGRDAATQPGAAPVTSASSLRLPSDLQLSGSKTIGVTFGRNREASLEQSLRVQVSGKLGEDLGVNAVLSDDNLPVLPEGNTEELGDLNKVFVQIQGPVVGGVVGDFELQRQRGQFTRFGRELRGGEATLGFGATRLSGSAGSAKGELRTATFRGIEGKQGPYELLSARRLEFSTLLPGSERVYLDGNLLRRGEAQDYVIDYDRGELRFTSRRRITADSEIAVDFQVTTERFRRETRAAGFETGRGSWRLDGFFLHEGDDPDHPVGGAFTPEEIATLQAAGDADAVAPGIEVVAPGSGSYRYALPDSFVVYDAVLGDLRVDFWEIGSGRGSYEDSLDAVSGKRFFVFVGPQRGTFEVGRLLSPPNRTRLVSTFVEGKPWDGAQLVAEASLTDADGNLLSEGDDSNNLGEAIDVWLDTGDGATLAGKLGATARYTQLSSRFQSPGRTRPGFFYKDWNAEQDTLKGVERLGETTLRWGLGATPWLQLDTNVGRLDRGTALVTDRLQFDFRAGKPAERGIEFRWQALDTSRPELGADAGRSRLFTRGTARYRLGPFLPEVRVETDEFVRADIDSLARESFRYLDVHSALGIGRGEQRAILEFGRRDTDARASSAERAAGLPEWEPARRNDTWGVSVLGQLSRAVHAEAQWSRRNNQPLGSAAEPATESDLARATINVRPRQRAIRSELRYEVSEEDVRLLDQVLVLAADGRGDYDAEGRPVGKDQGLYDKVYRYLGAAERVTQLAASMRLEIGGVLRTVTADTSAGWLRRNVAATFVLSVQEQARNPDRSLYWLAPSAFQTDSTVFGSFRFRQEWAFLNGLREHALHLFLDWEDDLDGRFGGTRIDSKRRAATLRYDNTHAAPWALGAEAKLARRDRGGPLGAVVPGRPSADSYEVLQQGGLARIGYRLSANERLGVDVEATHQRDALSATTQVVLEATPSLVLAPLRSLRLFASVAAARVREDKPADVLPPFFFEPPGTRTRATVTGSYRLGQYLNLNLTYNGVRNTDGRTTYDVKAETRAIF
jgi:hypothetical protein